MILETAAASLGTALAGAPAGQEGSPTIVRITDSGTWSGALTYPGAWIRVEAASGQNPRIDCQASNVLSYSATGCEMVGVAVTATATGVSVLAPSAADLSFTLRNCAIHAGAIIRQKATGSVILADCVITARAIVEHQSGLTSLTLDRCVATLSGAPTTAAAIEVNTLQTLRVRRCTVSAPRLLDGLNVFAPTVADGRFETSLLLQSATRPDPWVRIRAGVLDLRRCTVSTVGDGIAVSGVSQFTATGTGFVGAGAAAYLDGEQSSASLTRCGVRGPTVGQGVAQAGTVTADPVLVAYRPQAGSPWIGAAGVVVLDQYLDLDGAPIPYSAQDIGCYQWSIRPSASVGIPWTAAPDGTPLGPWDLAPRAGDTEMDLLARAVILALTLHRGEWWLDRSYGSRLHTLRSDARDAETRAVWMAREALSWLPADVSADVSARREGDTLRLTVDLRRGSARRTVEVAA